MREILFRGKRLDNGQWVSGFFFTRDDYTVILKKKNAIYKGNNQKYHRISLTAFDVDPDTVGQYTGLTDKNGKRIFEGDIIQNVDGFVFGSQYKAVVKMGNEKDGTYMGCYFAESSLIDIDAYDFGYCEVIGNAIDNPDLLEVRE